MAKKEEKKKLTRPGVKKLLHDLVEEFRKTSKPKAHKPKKPKEKPTDSIQETINYLRVCTKYIVFDLEATRRENKYLRKLLRDNGVQI